MRNRVCVLLAAAFLLAWAAPARSGVIVNTFGPGNSYDAGVAWAVGNYPAPHPLDSFPAVAARFDLASAGTIDDVAVATTSSGAEYALVIASDVGGLPGAIVGTVSASFFGNGYIEFDPFIALAAGMYWLVMTSDDQGGWYWNNIGATGSGAGSVDGGATWFASVATLPAYRVGAVLAVPEPATLAVFGAGLAAFGVLRRGRERREANSATR